MDAPSARARLLRPILDLHPSRPAVWKPKVVFTRAMPRFDTTGLIDRVKVLRPARRENSSFRRRSSHSVTQHGTDRQEPGHTVSLLRLAYDLYTICGRLL